MLDFDVADLHKDVMETTPPPISPTPPPPIAPQPPRKGWWSRNWKWFVPTGCFTLIVLGALFVVCIVFLVFGVIKSSDAYQIAIDRAKGDQRVVAALGTPIREGMLPSGKTNMSGSSGDADLAIPISGPKGKGTVYAVGTKSEGKWTFSKFAVQIGGGETIDLNESTESKPAPEPGSISNEDTEEQTADERVEAITLARENGGKLQSVRNFTQTDNPEHVVVVLTEGNEGTHVRTVWTNLNAGGATNQKLWEKELVTDESNRADFSLSNSNSKLFPPGDYKIDVYLDDELVNTLHYKVQ